MNPQKAISDLAQLAVDCAEADWDGHHALPVNPVAVANATAFLRAMSQDLPSPEVAADPEGCVSFDWIRSRKRILSLSVGGSDKLAFAWHIGADVGCGVACFDGQTVPHEVVTRIAALSDEASGPSN